MWWIESFFFFFLIHLSYSMSAAIFSHCLFVYVYVISFIINFPIMKIYQQELNHLMYYNFYFYFWFCLALNPLFETIDSIYSKVFGFLFFFSHPFVPKYINELLENCYSTLEK